MLAPGNHQRSDRAVALINDLLAAPTETANVDFKDNNSAPALLQPFLWETGIAGEFPDRR